VDHVLLTENSSERPIESYLADFVRSGFLSYRQEPVPRAQIRTYNWCLSTHAHAFTWMAFFDADEFLVLRERCEES